jgi:hypothetical protein
VGAAEVTTKSWQVLVAHILEARDVQRHARATAMMAAGRYSLADLRHSIKQRRIAEADAKNDLLRGRP